MLISNFTQLAKHMLLVVPVPPTSGGFLRNRHNPTSHVCAPANVVFNLSNGLYAWIYRMPSNGLCTQVRDKKGRTSGSFQRLP
jgi:hypothetical protein